MSVLGGDDLLTAIPQLLLVPRDALEQTLERSGRHVLIKRHGLDIFPLHPGQQSPHINQQEHPPRSSSETIREPTQKLAEHFAQPCDILH